MCINLLGLHALNFTKYRCLFLIHKAVNGAACPDLADEAVD